MTLEVAGGSACQVPLMTAVNSTEAVTTAPANMSRRRRRGRRARP